MSLDRSTSISSQPENMLRRKIKTFASHVPLLMHGMFCILIGIFIHMIGVLISIARMLLGIDETLLQINEKIIWLSISIILVGIILGLIDLFVLLKYKRSPGGVRCDPIKNSKVTVVLTAYNDEESIADAVKDFKSNPLVKRIVVVSNNSIDRTLECAAGAGAIALNEPNPGYGHCVYRCLTEGSRYDDTDLILLCEGDLTFRAHDIDKFIAYAPHADIVNGSRIVEQLREYETQLSTFMYYGNFAVGKLLEIKHLGKGTFTDVGTTYKLCHKSALLRLLPLLNPEVNLEFNAYFMDTALENDFRMVECPITFYKRVGISKGGNVNNRRAMMVGLRMIKGLVFGWKKAKK